MLDLSLREKVLFYSFEKALPSEITGIEKTDTLKLLNV